MSSFVGNLLAIDEIHCRSHCAAVRVNLGFWLAALFQCVGYLLYQE